MYQHRRGLIGWRSESLTIPEQYSANVVTPAKSKNMTDISGQKFGRLTVISRAGKNAVRHCVWNCVCECGVHRIVSVYALLDARTVSCGGHLAEYATARFTRHGQATHNGYSQEYGCWKAMIQRCSNPKRKGYKNYGGRGIRVCPEGSSFDQFFLDMGPKPPGLTLDRTDVNGNYEKANCSWVTPSEQEYNKRLSKNHTTGVRGVSLAGINCCSVQISIDGKRVYLGCFPRTPEGIQVAAEVIKQARRRAKIFS